MVFNAGHRILGNISKDFVIQGLQSGKLRDIAEEVLTRTARNNKRACPLKPLMIIWLVVVLALYRTQSIANVFEQLLRWMRATEPELGRRPVTPEAVCHARDRLGALPLKLLHREIVDQILAPVEPTFRGLRLWGIDGVEFTVPDTVANDAAFGRHSSDRGQAAYPQVRGVMLTALATRQIYNACLLPSFSSETIAAPFLMRTLGSQDLLMVDRGLASFSLLLACRSQGAQFLVRISATWKPRFLRSLGPGDTLVELIPCKEAKSKLAKKDKGVKLVARMLRFKVGTGANAQIVRLLTSLLEPAVVPSLNLAREYHLRWECELAYKELKLELLAVTEGKQKTHLRSKSPVGVHQELWGAVIAHTLVRKLMLEGAEEAGVPPLEISFVDSLAVIKQALPSHQAARWAKKQLYCLRAALVKEIGLCLVDRPRRKRQFPRKVKRKMSNFALKGPEDRGMLLELTITFIQSQDEAMGS